MKIQKCRKKSHHFLTLWPWPLTYDLEKLIRSGRYHYQCVYQIWEQSIPWFLSYRVNTIAGGGRLATGGGRLWRKTITSPDPSDTGDIINSLRPGPVQLSENISYFIVSVEFAGLGVKTKFNSHLGSCAAQMPTNFRAIENYHKVLQHLQVQWCCY